MLLSQYIFFVRCETYLNTWIRCHSFKQLSTCSFRHLQNPINFELQIYQLHFLIIKRKEENFKSANYLIGLMPKLKPKQI